MNTNTKHTTGTYEIGDVVRYEDTANLFYAVVIKIDQSNQWNPYTLRHMETFEVIASDMAQAGWELVAR